ncbi:MAG: hypothetical protein TREMPRED_004617 [Tremellales sp. Tagirdzhanova-0007]|nr:MAG: hypothetical protein TREMPRED_004617 [Tremellales sp. Tagirdzhanova-0007]
MDQIAVTVGSSSLPESLSSSTPRRAKRVQSPTSKVANDHPDDDEEENSPESEIDEHLVTLPTDVVGVQYYDGLVGKGEHVMLRRQPENKYDSNAVQVLNASGQQVGHIPRTVAFKVAGLMDSAVITVEGKMVGQNLDKAHHYKLAMDMSIYTRPSHRAVLELELAWATPGGRGFEHMRTAQQSDKSNCQYKDPRFEGRGQVMGGEIGLNRMGSVGRAEEMRNLLEGLRKIGEDEKHAEDVMDTLTADIDVAKLPTHAAPPCVANGQLHVDLLPHQSQALQWMLSKEHPKLPSGVLDAPVQFWTRQAAAGGGGSEYWLNVATRTPQKEEPVLGRGGIMADGMGLGKTLSILALILATKNEIVPKLYSNTTLIVCPLSVISNWEKQIKDHVVAGQLTSYTYHGTGKDITAKLLQQYDVVLTTYQTVVSDVASSSISRGTPPKAKKGKTKAISGPLFNVIFKRLVADEGHVLRNPRAKMSQAFCALRAERRWICTGTPIINSPGHLRPADLGSLLSCLQVCAPLDQPQYFKSLLLRPLKNGEAAAVRLLQALVGEILLRRTKDSRNSSGHRLIELPAIEYFQCPIQLDSITRQLYDELRSASAVKFQEALQTGESTANVLAIITRMRQLCLSADLVPQSFIDELRRPPATRDGPVVAISSVSPEQREMLMAKLRQCIADAEECSVCFDVLRESRITDCGHAYCYPCIAEVIVHQPQCPMCRHPINQSSLLEMPLDTPEWVEPDSEGSVVKSAKIAELVRYLQIFDASDKTLVFSQFTSFLDRVATALKKQGIAFCRFDGSMDAKKRQEVIESFQTPVSSPKAGANPVVMLISLKSGAVGLNLTAASNVFLCDPWWQSAIEAQAIDRAHRMGQRKTVRVFQLIAEDTIESKVLAIQKRKDEIVAKTFESSNKGQTPQAKRQARFEELKALLGE